MKIRYLFIREAELWKNETEKKTEKDKLQNPVSDFNAKNEASLKRR